MTAANARSPDVNPFFFALKKQSLALPSIDALHFAVRLKPRDEQVSAARNQ